MLEAFPAISPLILAASIPVAIFAFVIALFAITGALAEPVKSPAIWILPLVLPSASGIDELVICEST